MEWGFRRGGWFGIVPLTPWVLVQLAGIVVKDPCCSGQAESGFGMNFVKAFCAYDITIIPLPIPYPIPSLALSISSTSLCCTGRVAGRPVLGGYKYKDWGDSSDS